MQTIILNENEWGEYLPPSLIDIYTKGILQKQITRIETYVLDRYREIERNRMSSTYHVSLTGLSQEPYLLGFEADENGDIDLKETDDGLLHALRLVISDILIDKMNSPDENLSSLSQDGRSATFRKGAGKISPTSFLPLERYDLTQKI